MPGTVLGLGYTVVKSTQDPCSHGAHSLVERTYIKQVIKQEHSFHIVVNMMQEKNKVL